MARGSPGRTTRCTRFAPATASSIARTSTEHTFIAGPDGLDYLVFATSFRTEFGWLPRSGAVRIGWPWVEGRADDPWEVEAQAPPLAYGEPAERPPNIVNVDEVELEELEARRDRARSPTRNARCRRGSTGSGSSPAAVASPPHCHSEEEEVFVILEGDGAARAVAVAARGEQRRPSDEDLPVRPGHVIARPPATRVAHSFLAGEDGITMLIYGTRKPNDMCYYPRSNKISWRGLGLIGRIEALDYDDGEPEN